MPKILSYQKITDEFTTHCLDVAGMTELCTIGKDTYVSVPDDAKTADVKTVEIKDVELTDELKIKIKAESPHAKLINERVVAKIREKYSIDDELKLLRQKAMEKVDPAAMKAYDDHVEACVLWGVEEKAKMGL